LLLNHRELYIPTEDELSEKYAALYPDITQRVKGKLSILAIYHHYNWENEALLPSLEKFGRVIHYDWFAEFDQQDEKKWQKKQKIDEHSSYRESGKVGKTRKVRHTNRCKSWGI